MNAEQRLNLTVQRLLDPRFDHPPIIFDSLVDEILEIAGGPYKRTVIENAWDVLHVLGLEDEAVDRAHEYGWPGHAERAKRKAARSAQ